MELQQTWRATRTLVSALFFSALTSSSFAWFGRPEYLNITVGSSILLPCLKNKVLTLGHWERMASSRNEKWNFKDQCGTICNHKCSFKTKSNNILAQCNIYLQEIWPGILRPIQLGSDLRHAYLIVNWYNRLKYYIICPFILIHLPPSLHTISFGRADFPVLNRTENFASNFVMTNQAYKVSTSTTIR